MGPHKTTEIFQKGMGKNMRTSGAEAFQDVRLETPCGDGDAVGSKRPSGSSYRGSGARFEANAQTVLPSEPRSEAGSRPSARQEAIHICANSGVVTAKTQVIETMPNRVLDKDPNVHTIGRVTKKKHIPRKNWRPKADDLKLISDLQRKLGVSEADILRLGVRCLYDRELSGNLQSKG
jgi:hypothetical protein